MMPAPLAKLLSQPHSRLHDRLLNFARPRLIASARFMEQSHPQFRECEELYRAYRRPDQNDEEVSAASDTLGVQKIIVPLSYAVVQSMLAFFMTVFTDRKPIFPVEPYGGEQKGAILHEHLIEYQMDNPIFRGVLTMIQQLLDTLRYGQGWAKHVWTILEWPELIRRFEPILAGGQIVGWDSVLEEEDVIAYEGNVSIPISPYDVYPDPTLPIARFQEGEFWAHGFKLPWSQAITRAQQGLYVGLEFVEARASDVRSDWEVGSNESASQLSRTLGVDPDAYTSGMARGAALIEDGRPPFRMHEMYVRLIPSELGLAGVTEGNPDAPRLWVLTLANLQRVVRAEPANLPSARFPATCIELNRDAHSARNPGVIETVKYLEYLISWLYNARMASVRRTLNNEIVVDPTLIEPADILRPNPSGIWRLSKDAWRSGLSLDQIVKPLPVTDVTQGHAQDAKLLMDLMEQVTGANRLIQGLANPGRRAATEVNAQLSLSSGRMKLLAALCAAQGFIPQGEIYVRNNQAFLAEQLTLKVREGYQDILGLFVDIGPQMLAGNFRIPLLEQGIPTDRAFHAATLKELLALGMQTPQVAMQMAQQINFSEVFLELLRVLNKRNLRDFINTAPPLPPTAPQAQIMDDEQAQREAQRGNLVPIDQGQVLMPSDGFPLPPPGASPMGNQAAMM